MRAELDKLVANKIIAPVTEPTEWISALLAVRKSNGDVRICIDPKPLNKALLRSHFLMPTIEDVLPELSKAKCFTCLDARHGFFHLCLDEESSKLTCFETNFGRFRWLRLAQGLSVSPELFQRHLLDKLHGLDGVACIADDILVYGCGDTTEQAVADHDRKLIALFERCRQCGLRLNKDKMKLRMTSVAFMGHELTAEGLKPDPAKIAAIQDMLPPEDKKAPQRLLGMVTYLGKFVPVLSEKTTVLRTLLENATNFVGLMMYTVSHLKN